MIEFEHGCAVITGGSSGIGRGIADQLAGCGMPVVIVGRDRDRAESAAAEIRGRGAEAQAIVCDVSDREAVFNLAQTVKDRYGSIELLALNAGVTTAGPLLEHVPEDWDWVFGTVLSGVANGIQAFLPDMVTANRGHVLITASIVGLVPGHFLHHGPYSAAKAGVIGLGVSLGTELQDTGVGLSVLIPAGVYSELVETHVGRPAITSGVMSLSTAPHPMKTIRTTATEAGDWNMLTPSQVALRVIDGIQRDEFFIMTHPEFKPIYEAYTRRILRAFDDSAAWNRENT